MITKEQANTLLNLAQNLEDDSANLAKELSEGYSISFFNEARKELQNTRDSFKQFIESITQC